MHGRHMAIEGLGLVPAVQGSISSPALLPYLELLSPIPSSVLPVLPASTTSEVPTFLLHMPPSLLLYRPSFLTYIPSLLLPNFWSPFPKHQRTGPTDPWVSLNTSQQPPITTPHPFTPRGPCSSLASVTPTLAPFPSPPDGRRYSPRPTFPWRPLPLYPAGVIAIPSYTPPSDSDSPLS